MLNPYICDVAIREGLSATDRDFQLVEAVHELPCNPKSKMDSEEKQYLRKIGSYHLIFLLGRGGTGEVYKAFDPGRNLYVAIKLYSTAIMSDEEAHKVRLRQAVSSFEREARAISALTHQNVAKIYTVRSTDDGIPYLVMEYVDGPSLSDLIRNKAELTYSQIADLMAQAAMGLQAAYQLKILHLDIKPGNIMLTSDNVVKLVDFGQAKFLMHETGPAGGPMDPETPSTGERPVTPTLGTPRYMSPEQGLGQTAGHPAAPSGDHRSDIYSLGATFYHLLAGQPPYDATTAQELIQQHVVGTYVPIYLVNPKVPGGLCEIVAKMMARDPNDRYQDYDELIHDLNQEKLTLLSKEEGDFVPYTASSDDSFQTHSDTDFVETDHDLSVPPPLSAQQFSKHSRLAPEKLRRILDVQVGPPAKSPVGRSIFIGFGVLLMLLGFCTVVWPHWWSYSTPDSLRPGTALKPLALFVDRLKQLGVPHRDGSSRESYLAQIAATKKRMQKLRNAFLTYEAEMGKAANSLKELARARYVEPDALADTWGNNIVLLRFERKFFSYGLDGTENTTDDILLDSSGRFLKLPAEDIIHTMESQTRQIESDSAPMTAQPFQ